MITFDLTCHVGHRFEGWFRNREDFDEQLAGGVLGCPICGSAQIEKGLSAVAVHVARRTAPALPPKEPASEVPAPKAFFAALSQFIETHFEDVGPRFADEARRIDTGEVEARNIRGTTTPEEEERLQEEGVEFLKLALPKYDA